jgi:hypothetical protein
LAEEERLLKEAEEAERVRLADEARLAEIEQETEGEIARQGLYFQETMKDSNLHFKFLSL